MRQGPRHHPTKRPAVHSLSQAPKTSKKNYSSKCNRQTLSIKNGKMEKWKNLFGENLPNASLHFSIFPFFRHSGTHSHASCQHSAGHRPQKKWKNGKIAIINSASPTPKKPLPKTTSPPNSGAGSDDEGSPPTSTIN